MGLGGGVGSWPLDSWTANLLGVRVGVRLGVGVGARVGVRVGLRVGVRVGFHRMVPTHSQHGTARTPKDNLARRGVRPGVGARVGVGRVWGTLTT